MRLTVIGNEGPYPSHGGATSGYLVRAEGTILIECGSGVVSKLMGMIALESLDAVILSHLHFDHMGDLAVLGYAYQSMAARGALPEGFRLPVYLPASPGEMIDGIRKYNSGGVFDFIEIAEGDSIEIAGVRIDFCPARHPVECVGMRMKDGTGTLCYTGDTNTLDSLSTHAKGADLLLADAGLPSSMWSEKSPHLSAKLCGKLARESGAKRLVLTHLPPYCDGEELLAEARTEFETAELSVIGGTYEI